MADCILVGNRTTGGSNSGVTYSLNEVKTDDVWIDGKPIYRRTVQFTQWGQTINASSWNIDTFFVDYVHSYFKGHVGTNPPYILPFSIVNAQADMYYDITNASIIWRASGFTTNTLDAAYFTILYTKTTDTGNG